jgi:hypothetical protein
MKKDIRSSDTVKIMITFAQVTQSRFSENMRDEMISILQVEESGYKQAIKELDEMIETINSITW